MKLKHIDTSREDRRDYESLVPTGGMRVVDSQALPESIRQVCGAMLKKCPWTYAVASGCVSGDVTFCFIPARLDDRRPEVDLDPIGVRFHGADPSFSGCFRLHSDFPRRVVPIERSLWEGLRSGVVSGYCALPGLPATTSGTIAGLDPSSTLHAAFAYIDARLRGC
jgi:hypothetical protein